MMKQIKRLDVDSGGDPYRKAQRGALRCWTMSEAAFQTLERERPELVIVDGDAVLVGWPRRQRLDLEYAFRDRDAFARQFPAMFGRLLPALRMEEAPLGIRIRLTNRSDRPYVEPLLFAQAFELSREWMEMTLVELPDESGAPGDDVAPGFRLRPATADDAEAIVRLEEACFPNPQLTLEGAREAVRGALLFRLLEEARTGTLAASLLLERRGSLGYVSTIAVHPDYQRRGLGEALMRWALAWFRSQGLRSAALTVTVGNGPAIALYRKLGFTVTEMGLDYRRPIDEDEVRQVLEKHRAVHISVKRWSRR